MTMAMPRTTSMEAILFDESVNVLCMLVGLMSGGPGGRVAGYWLPGSQLPVTGYQFPVAACVILFSFFLKPYTPSLKPYTFLPMP